MGLTTTAIQIGNPGNPEITQELEFLLDSGMMRSVVPRPVLDRLGIEPLAETTFRLSDGSKIVRKKGAAIFKYGDLIGGADVVFGEPGDAVLCGALTLEALGLWLHPLRRELIPLPMLLYGNARIREVCAERGIDWDGLSEEERERLIDDLLHES